MRAVLGRLRRSSLLRSSGVYAFSNVINRAIPFLLLPVLTRYLSPEDFGKAAMFTVAVNLALPFVGVSTDSAIGRQYFERDRIDLPRYVTNCLYILIITAILWLLVTLLVPDRLAAALDLPSSWIWSIVLVAASRFIVNTVLVLWQVQNRTVPYAAYSLLQTALTFGLSIVFIVPLGYGWEGRVLAEIISVTGLALAGLALLWRGGWIRSGLDWGYIGHALTFGGWIIPHVYGSVLIVTADRFFLTNLFGVDEMGLYTAAAQIASIVLVVAQSFNLAWSPWAYARLKANEPGALAALVRVRRLFYAGIIVLALLLTLSASLLFTLLVGPGFAGGAKFAFWLTIGQAFMAMYQVTVTPVFFANKTHLLGIISVSVGLASVLFNYVLISANGAIGAAQASALTTLMLFAIVVALVARVIRQLTPSRGADDPRVPIPGE
jgi:O-antigen/teichoic acid export membrane protein